MAATTPPKSDVEKAATTARESGCDDKEAEENQTSSQGDQDELLVTEISFNPLDEILSFIRLAYD